VKMSKAERRKVAARYPKFVEWSEEDACFIGRCPLLFRGGVHGADEAAVYKELCQVVEEWVGTLEKDGVALPPTTTPGDYSGKFLVRIQPALHQRLALKALASGESLNSLVARKLASG
jgi:predicted HicB family RNase H-like nuclease